VRPEIGSCQFPERRPCSIEQSARDRALVECRKPGTLAFQERVLAVMRLSTIEGDFLRRLSVEPWTSPPVFDHGLLDRVVRENYVTTLATGHGVRYEITDLGRAEILKAG
jgi:hypothetical protein